MQEKKPNNKKKATPLSKLKQGMKSLKLSKPTKTDTARASCKWYQDITVLPLNRFIDVSVDGDLSALVIEGDPDINDLARTWIDIQQQYADVVADNEMKMIIKLQAAHGQLLIKMQMFDFLFEHMQKYYCVQFGREMNDLLKTSFKFDPTDRVAYYKLLDRCYNRSKGFSIEFKVSEIKLDGILSKRTGAPPTRQYYQGMLIGLSDFVKYPIHDTITVWEYCERIRLYNIYDEKVRREIEKHGKK